MYTTIFRNFTTSKALHEWNVTLLLDFHNLPIHYKFDFKITSIVYYLVTQALVPSITSGDGGCKQEGGGDGI
jgi:hypothetical protein